MEDNKKKLQQVASWMILFFALVFAMSVAVIWIAVYPLSGGSAFRALGITLARIWYILVGDALLCILAYLGVARYLQRRG